MRLTPFGRIARPQPQATASASRPAVWKVGILLLAAILALAVTGMAAAQSSPSFQLGCWGIVTAGGGVRSSTFYRISDSIGQVGVGQSASANFIVRAGYIQPSLVVPNVRAAIVDAPENPAQGAQIYIPILNRSVSIIYVCPY